MTTIFIKSYKRDFPYLKYAIQSINKNVTGLYNVLLLIDQADDLPDEIMQHVTDKYKIVYVEKFGNGYLFQQLCKLNAHKYTDAEYILFSDSDCIFDHAINVDEFIADGKPEILYTHYSKVGDAVCWKQCTEQFIGVELEYEFMRRNCLIFHRSTLVEMEHKYPSMASSVMSKGRFSEFNAMGAYCYLYNKDKYNFVNTDEWQYVEPKGIQLWSHAEKGGSGVHKTEYDRAIDTINKALELNITEL